MFDKVLAYYFAVSEAYQTSKIYVQMIRNLRVNLFLKTIICAQFFIWK